MTRFVVEEFERQFAVRFGVPHAIAVNSGTSALIACLWSLGLQPGDEVITTPFTFVATANAIVIAGGTPVFADIRPDTLLIDHDDVSRKITRRTKAIVPVHLFGRVADVKNISKLAEQFRLVVIEDTAQALGAVGEFGLAGTLADAGCYSFYQSKNLSTFEGGMIALPSGTRLDPTVIRAITNQGDVGGRRYEHIGFNLRLPEPCALIGLHLLTRHWPAVMSELGRYGANDGYYPQLVYQHEAYKRRGIGGHCPVAEAIAADINGKMRGTT